MLIKCIDGFTRQFGAPADWDGKDMSCGVLPVLDVETGEGNFMFSAWEPTRPELEALNKGANIVLRVRGTAHPVVSLQVAADVAVKHPDDVAVDQFAEAMKAKLADARAKGRSGWQDCDPAELSYMLREHVEKGDPRDVANFCMFLWSLGKPIGDTRPVVNLQLTPLDGIQVWIEAYTTAANGPHFMGHGRIVQLLREYLALRKLLAQRTPPPLPETHYNGSGDGSEPLYTADMLHLYASQYAASLALPVWPVPEGYVLMPRRLTAENGAKAALSGEFAEKATYHCSQCDHEEPDDGCEECNGKGSYLVDVPIEWDTIKRIYDKAAEELAASSPAVAQPVADERAQYEHNLRVGYQNHNLKRQERGLASSDQLTAEQEREIAKHVELAFPSNTRVTSKPVHVSRKDTPIAFSCAKRAAHPTSWTMTCDKHCGDDSKCLRAALCPPAEEGGKA